MQVAEGDLHGCMPSQHPRARPAGPDRRRDTTRPGRPPRMTPGPHTTRLHKDRLCPAPPEEPTHRGLSTRNCPHRTRRFRLLDQALMRRPTSLAQAKQPRPTDRRREARHPDDHLLSGEVQDLEPVQSLQRLHGDARLYTEAGGEITEVDVDTSWSLLECSPQATSEQRRRRTEILRPNLLDVRIAKPPPVVGLR